MGNFPGIFGRYNCLDYVNFPAAPAERKIEEENTKKQQRTSPAAFDILK